MYKRRSPSLTNLTINSIMSKRKIGKTYFTYNDVNYIFPAPMEIICTYVLYIKNVEVMRINHYFDKNALLLFVHVSRNNNNNKNKLYKNLNVKREFLETSNLLLIEIFNQN